jgi:hypothetical protein
LGAGVALPGGAAVDDESAGADDGDAAGGGLSPPHATTIAPNDITAARSATIPIFFMIVFSSDGPERRCPHANKNSERGA